MKTIDFTPLYRSTIGFDRLPSLFDSVARMDRAPAYPPYNVEAVDDNHYTITVAVAGFDRDELEIAVENHVLTITGTKAAEEKRDYLYQGIANRAFERKFSLADYVEVTDANLENGLLTVTLVREIPEAMRPKKIDIGSSRVIENEAA